MYDIYQIKLNDTIESLANRYGTTIEELRRLNPNSSFGVGSNIIVPTTKEYFEVYTIEKGDNLYNIARRYNTDYNLLALLNGLNVNDYIYPNNTILVPKKDVKYYFTKKDDTIASGVIKAADFTSDTNEEVEELSNSIIQKLQNKEKKDEISKASA